MTKVALGVLASGPAADAVARHVPQLVADGFASRLFVKDPTLWGPDAESESAVRLSWVALGQTSRPLLGEVAALRDLLAEQGVDHVVLCGMGGSSHRQHDADQDDAGGCRSWPDRWGPGDRQL